MDSQPRTTNVALKIHGVRYDYWQRVEYRASVDDLCASLSLHITSQGSTYLPIDENTVIEALVKESLLQTVRIDSLRQSVSPTDHKISLGARSLGREFVDCQYSKTLNNLKLAEIIKRLGDEFAVPVTINAETAVVPNFAMQCEAPANAILNAVRAANLLLYPTPDGGLVLTEPTDAAPVATLRAGHRIKEYEIVDEFKLRFSEYTVKGFDYDGNKATRGEVKDEAITYFRPMQIVADKHGKSEGGCDRRAELERNRRLARAHRIELTVSGWEYFDEAGKEHLWAVNTQIRVQLPNEGIDAVLLIGEVSLSLDIKGGHVAKLTVMDRNAYLGEKTKKTKKGKKGQSTDKSDLTPFYPTGERYDE